MSTKESQIKSENSVNDLFQKCRDLEYDLQELLSQYKPVKKRIKVLQNRYRIELGTSKDKFKKDDLNEDAKVNDNNNEKNEIAPTSEEESNKKRKLDQYSNDIEDEERRKIAKNDLDEARKKRMLSLPGSQKLFKNLLFGRLDSFKKESSNEKNLKTEERRRAIEKEVLEKSELEDQKMIEERKMKIENELNELKKEEEEFESKIAEKQNQIMELRKKSHEEALKNFIKTKSFPRIYYIPKKIDDFVKGLIQHSRRDYKDQDYEN